MQKLRSNAPSLLLTILVSTLLAPLPAASGDALIESLQGCWQGKAIKTPRGPLPYPICFEISEENTLYGIAKLSVSQHHWRFYLGSTKTRLKFLSTFAGNQTPIHLSLIHDDAERLIFAADNKQYLQVEIKQQHDGYQFTIKLKGKEHVIIRLVPEDVTEEGATQEETSLEKDFAEKD
ncbi:hypothetical protein MD588_08910 [Photobacterium sp. SDRW27]|uniref:hypothetical protein n=1 Tax=Photobacterium obscurum TaxID=2829490 RepID=UPI00224368C7|nr:hypothetical protein [Photobacterium obscurum]MCW8328928.1 hypothetical protein [Photobacterium obscurum]